MAVVTSCENAQKRYNIVKGTEQRREAGLPKYEML